MLAIRVACCERSGSPSGGSREGPDFFYNPENYGRRVEQTNLMEIDPDKADAGPTRQDSGAPDREGGGEQSGGDSRGATPD